MHPVMFELIFFSEMLFAFETNELNNYDRYCCNKVSNLFSCVCVTFSLMNNVRTCQLCVLVFDYFLITSNMHIFAC